MWQGKVEDGALKIKRAGDFRSWLTRMEGDIELIVRRPRKDRSPNQNSYFHAVVCKVIGDHLGYSMQEIKGILKWLHLPPGVGTSDLSTAEAEEFFTRCRVWASTDLGITVPLPNESV